MSRFAVLAWDAADAEEPRRRELQAHFAHTERVLDRLLVAGPLRDEAGAFTGSLMIVEAEDAAAARALVEADPYFGAGVWARVEVHAFLPAAGTWIGGKVW